MMGASRELAELASSYNSGGLSNMRNRIINGAMGIWQRGTSSSTLGAYVADRWGVTAGTSVTASRSTDVPAGFQYSLSLAGTNFPQTFQRIESLNCVDLPGQTITVSFWAKQTSGAAANSLAVGLATPNATDNYSAVTVIVTAVTFTGSTSWTQYSVTFTNLNSSVVNGLQVLIYANTSGAATFLVTGVQLEKGSTATSFDYRPYGTELQLAQRYFQVINGFSGTANATNNIHIKGQFWVPMRTAPAVSQDATLSIDDTQTAFNQSAASVSALGTMSSTSYRVTAGNFTGLTIRQVYFEAVGSLLFSAEL